MAPKPQDEAVRLMRFRAPLELELVDRRPVPAVPTPQCWHCAMTNHRPLADVSDVAAEVVVSVLLLFWSCSLSSCQANQKIYAYGLLLVEREGWLVNGNYTNRTPHWAAESHL